MKKIHFFIIPLILLGLSLLYKSDCSTEFCLFDGRGFPLGVGDYRLFPLVVNYIFFFLVYSIIVIKIQNRNENNRKSKN